MVRPKLKIDIDDLVDLVLSKKLIPEVYRIRARDNTLWEQLLTEGLSHSVVLFDENKHGFVIHPNDGPLSAILMDYYNIFKSDLEYDTVLTLVLHTKIGELNGNK